jgi:AraC-like DNA-binding protein
MNQFLLQASSRELEGFPHIIEVGIRKNTTIQLNSWARSIAEDCIRIYYVLEGKFEWIIDERHHILYPGDLAIVLPHQSLKGEKDFLDIGTFFWIQIRVECDATNKNFSLKPWSGLSESESLTICRIQQLSKAAVLVRMKEAYTILQNMRTELYEQQIGYKTRVNQLIDELLVLIARQSTHQNNLQRDFPLVFVKLEGALRQNLAHQWTVEEMAAMVGLGTTAFSEKVKNYTGFSPLNYLINIRISEAIKLLRKPDVNVTSVALDTGFYSSQHFATTFKKLTGYTPGEFRKKDMLKN